MKNLKLVLLLLVLLVTTNVSLTAQTWDFGTVTIMSDRDLNFSDKTSENTLDSLHKYDSEFKDDVKYFKLIMRRSQMVSMTLKVASNGQTGSVRVYINDSLYKRYSDITVSNPIVDIDTILHKGDKLKVECVLDVATAVVLLDLKLDQTVGFSESVPTFEMNMYPNPVMSNLNFTFDDYPNQVLYTVYNMSGQMVMNGELNNELYVGDLTNGMYVINLIVDGTILNKKFLKR